MALSCQVSLVANNSPQKEYFCLIALSLAPLANETIYIGGGLVVELKVIFEWHKQSSSKNYLSVIPCSTQLQVVCIIV